MKGTTYLWKYIHGAIVHREVIDKVYKTGEIRTVTHSGADARNIYSTVFPSVAALNDTMHSGRYRQLIKIIYPFDLYYEKF